MLVILHRACMSLATLVCSVVAVTSYAFVQPGARNKPHIRKGIGCGIYSVPR